MNSTNNGGRLTTSEVYMILNKLGYEWSNEAQCYYSTDYQLSVLQHNEGRELATRIKKYFGGNK